MKVASSIVYPVIVNTRFNNLNESTILFNFGDDFNIVSTSFISPVNHSLYFTGEWTLSTSQSDSNFKSSVFHQGVSAGFSLEVDHFISAGFGIYFMRNLFKKKITLCACEYGWDSQSIYFLTTKKLLFFSLKIKKKFYLGNKIVLFFFKKKKAPPKYVKWSAPKTGAVGVACTYYIALYHTAYSII